MLSSVLRSPRAVAVNVEIMRMSPTESKPRRRIGFDAREKE
jgi:hypothetical protein